MELQEIPFLSNVKILIGAVRNPWVVWGFCRMLGTGVDRSKSQRRLDDQNIQISQFYTVYPALAMVSPFFLLSEPPPAPPGALHGLLRVLSF